MTEPERGGPESDVPRRVAHLEQVLKPLIAVLANRLVAVIIVALLVAFVTVFGFRIYFDLPGRIAELQSSLDAVHAQLVINQTAAKDLDERMHAFERRADRLDDSAANAKSIVEAAVAAANTAKQAADELTKVAERANAIAAKASLSAEDASNAAATAGSSARAAAEQARAAGAAAESAAREAQAASATARAALESLRAEVDRMTKAVAAGQKDQPQPQPVPQPPAQEAKSQDPFIVRISGDSNAVSLIEGAPAEKSAVVSSDASMARVLVPSNAPVILEITGDSNSVLIPRRLSGFITVKDSGDSNAVRYY